MRRVVLSFWISLDGYSCDEGSELYQFMVESPDDEQWDEYGLSQLQQVGTHILGRVTYEAWAGFWPKVDNPMAHAFNDTPKVVFSKTLQSADWAGTRIASGDTAEEIARLKAEPGGDIVAHGGLTFARSLIRLGQVDEYRLLVLPAAVGRGERLFTDLDHLLPLRPVATRTFSNGLLELAYSPS